MEQLSLEKAAERLEMVSDAWHTFFDRRTGKFIDISEEAMRVAEYYGAEAELDSYSDWEREDILIAAKIQEEWTDGNYVRFPTPFDLNEYSIMEKFVQSQRDGKKRDCLERAISGKGAFRRFKDSVRSMELEDAWYEYRKQEFFVIAKSWCEENEIPYVTKSGDGEKP